MNSNDYVWVLNVPTPNISKPSYVEAVLATPFIFDTLREVLATPFIFDTLREERMTPSVYNPPSMSINRQTSVTFNSELEKIEFLGINRHFSPIQPEPVQSSSRIVRTVTPIPLSIVNNDMDGMQPYHSHYIQEKTARRSSRFNKGYKC
jgi:hypothetical protein